MWITEHQGVCGKLFNATITASWSEKALDKNVLPDNYV